jgi:predicted DCC family thiol-disulfide oxidoreductase YuxK
VELTAVLFDVDCGFCRASLGLLLAWDRHRRLRPVSLQSAEAERLLPGMQPERRMASWHLLPPGQPPLSAGAAAAPLLRLLPGGRPLAALAERFPRFVERAYFVVADHRSTLGKAIPAALVRRADALIAERGSAGNG